jgi:hypothetical protein
VLICCQFPVMGCFQHCPRLGREAGAARQRGAPRRACRPVRAAGIMDRIEGAAHDTADSASAAVYVYGDLKDDLREPGIAGERRAPLLCLWRNSRL